MHQPWGSIVPARFRNRRPVLLRLRSAPWFITFAVCVAFFTDVFLYAVIVPVLPFAMEARVGVPGDQVQHWVSVLLAIYAGALLVSAPIFGILADRIKSRQTPLLGGFIVLLGSTVMFCFGRSIPVLVVARLLQGASSGVVWTVALALLSDTVGKDESAQAIGYVAAAYSAGTLAGPLLGGLLYQEGGYYETFAVAFGAIGLDIVLRLLIIEKHKAARWLDDAPASSENVELQDRSMADPASSRADADKTTGTAGMIAVPPKRKLPTILVLAKSRRLQAAFIGIFIPAATMTAFDATLPLFVNRVFNWGSLGAGLIFIAMLVPHLAGPVIGRYVDKVGPRWIATAGLILLLPCWVLLRLVDHDGIRQIVLLVGLLVGVGIACALINTSLMAEFSKVCDSKEKKDPGLFNGKSAYATSFGIMNVSWAVGMLVGPLMAAAIERSAGWKTMTWCFALLAAVCTPVVVMFTGGMITRRKARTPAATTDGG